MTDSTWTWIGATADPTLSSNWSPTGRPQTGDTAIIPGGTIVTPDYPGASLSGITFDLVANGALAFSNNTTNASTSQIDALSVIDATGTAATLSLSGPFTNLGTIEVTGTQASLTIPIAADGAAPGSLINQGQIIVDQGDTLAINGGTISDPGAVLVEGGTATIAGTLAGLGNFAVDTGGTLELNQAGGVALTEITFTGMTGLVKLDAPAAFVGGINGFAPGDTIDLGVANVSTVVFDGTGDMIAIGSTGTVFAASLSGFDTSGTFELSGTGGLAGNLQVTEGGGDTRITSADLVSCFAAGTRIATASGPKRVEELAVSDTVRTALDGRSQPIVWIGQRSIDCARHPKPQQVWPVRIATGAFGRGQPARELYLSPDHAVFVDGVLIPVKYLVNGETIAQVPCDSVTYYHLELPRHDVVLADGLPAESYLDTGDRGNFANSGRPIALYPDFSSRVWAAAGCAELIVTGPKLDAVRERLARMAGRKRGARKRAA